MYRCLSYVQPKVLQRLLRSSQHGKNYELMTCRYFPVVYVPRFEEVLFWYSWGGGATMPVEATVPSLLF